MFGKVSAPFFFNSIDGVGGIGRGFEVNFEFLSGKLDIQNSGTIALDSYCFGFFKLPQIGIVTLKLRIIAGSGMGVLYTVIARNGMGMFGLGSNQCIAATGIIRMRVIKTAAKTVLIVRGMRTI